MKQIRPGSINHHLLPLHKAAGVCIIIVLLLLSGCKTTKKKEDVKGLGMFYHNMTARYNGYFNATEIMKESHETLENQYQDNYNRLLPVFEYAAIDDPGPVAGEMDEVIKKASVGISLHRPSKWTDDNYLIIGQAQFIKQDYESAQKTLEYMVNNFTETGKSTAKIDPNADRKKSKREKIAERQEKIKEKTKEIKERQKDQAKDKKERKKEIEDRKKAKKQEAKERKKARKKEIRERKKARKIAAKNRKRIRKGKDPIPLKTERESDAPKKTEDKAESNSEVKPKADEQTEPESKDQEEQPERHDWADDHADEEIEAMKIKEDKIKTGMFAHHPAYAGALLWLAKTYVERDFRTQAEVMFQRADEASQKNDAYLEEYYPSLAHFYIKTERYPDAIEALTNGIEHTNQRALKARYAYIIGQLHMLNGTSSAAVTSFDQAAKWSRDYEMSFMAQLNSQLAGLTSGSQSRPDVIKSLEKMLKDDKNEEFLDQIYFQIAKVYLESNDMASAQTNLELALEASSGNQERKTEIHFELAEIFYNQDRFDLAFDHYSAALSSMSKSDSRYYPLEETKNRLSEIAVHLKSLNLQDSLLMLAALPESELKERANEILKAKEERLEKAREKANKATSPRSLPTSAAHRQGAVPIATSNMVETNFFAYNDKALKKGARNFQKVWGDRVLADNWRRESADPEEEEIIPPSLVEEKEDEVQMEDVEQVFKNVPFTDDQKKSAHTKIADALFGLGMEYRNQLDRLDLSSEAFLRFVNEYPDDDRVPDAYYFLYLNANDAGHHQKAKEYAGILKQEYPDSKFTQMIADPGYLDSIQSGALAAEDFYAQTYEAFQAGEYQEVFDAFNKAKKTFGSSDPNLPKLALLKAMSVGKLSSKEEYVDALRTVIAQYPNTNVQVRAREIVRFLTGKDDAFDENPAAKERVTSYKEDFEKLHYVIVVIYNDDLVSMDDVKINIADYHKLYHKLERYSLRSFTIDRQNEVQAILVRKFDDREAAMKYYNTAMKRMEDYLPSDTDGELFAISQSNYRQMIVSKSHETYRDFFQQHYLNN